MIHFQCKCCKKEYERYSIPQIVLNTMLKLDILNHYHINLCKSCLKEEIAYCTTDNEEPDPSLKGQEL